MKPIPGFVGPAYQAPSLTVNAQRCINFLLEVDDTAAKVPVSLQGVPGLRKLLEASGGAVKQFVESNGVLYAAIGQSFGRIEPDFSAFDVLGTFAGTGRVTLVSNGLQILVVDGLSGFVFDVASNSWTQITDSGFVYGATQATYQDGYGIVALPDSQQFGISGIYDFLTWNAIDFASAEGLPDNVASVISNHRLLHVFGTKTTELWYNGGDSAFPFQRVDGAFFDVGCSAPYSVAVADDSVFWLGNNAQGGLGVFRMQGQSPSRISTVALEREIATYATVSDAYAVGLDVGRHPIYMIIFPTANATWCYDAHSQSWLEWLEWAPDSFARYRLNCFASAYGKLLVGDYRDGRVYELTHEAFDNAGDVLRSLRATPYVWKNGQMLFHSRLEILHEAGVGITAGYGVDPEMALRWSNDGKTWSNELFAKMGKLGEYNARAVFTRLGASRQRMYELVIDAPVKRVILAGLLDVSSK